jgi:uncharacterized repeat protein (TIGR01451 family)
MGKNVSETIASPGDSLTYSIGITVTGNSVSNVVVTDILPTEVAFGRYLSAPAGTQENQSPPPLQWTLPSPLGVGVYQLTYQVTVNNNASGATVTNNAQLTYTGMPATLTSSVNVQVVGQYTINVNIYNEAGEVVKTIQVQKYSVPINSIVLPSNLITTLQGPGSTVLVYFDGALITTWDGSNNSGNPVTNGNYEIKVDSVSPVGVVTSVQQQVTVDRKLSNVTATIYNSAGEVVRTLYYLRDDPTNSQMTSVNLSSFVMNPAGPMNSRTSNLQIYIMTSGAPVTLTWDGTNNEGTNVTPGTYEIGLHWDNGEGITSDITRTVLVMGAWASGMVVAQPNVLEASQGNMTTTFSGMGIANASTLTVRIYTIAGELLTTITGTPGIATAPWNASGMASGVYIAVVAVQDGSGGVVAQQRLKLLVLH